jgi:hypothetical protein
MGRIRTNIIVVLITTTFLGSCSVLGIEHFFERGKVNDNGQYVPKRPNYRLKDKKNFSIPDNLDTCGIYKLQTTIADKKVKNDKNKHFIKFFSTGRCLSITIPNIRELKEKDLNPENSYSKKNYYYYYPDDKIIKIESFVYGEGYGRFVILDYSLTANGDSLLLKTKNSRLIYTKTNIPGKWRKYKVNW